MGLTFSSSQKESMTDIFNINKKNNEFVIALCGNPNTGKSSIFNILTGLNQHTGNWPGKTVVNARGAFPYKDKDFILMDLPGTYSLFSTSVEEEVARDYLCFGNSDLAVVVTDATCLERNLNLVFQVMELKEKVILCINLIDEAERKHIEIDAENLKKSLGIPVVLTSARDGRGIEELKDTLNKAVENNITFTPNIIKYDSSIENEVSHIVNKLKGLKYPLNLRWLALRLIDGEPKLLDSLYSRLEENDLSLIKNINSQLNSSKSKVREIIVETNYRYAEDLKNRYVKEKDSKKISRDIKIDNILTSKTFGLPIMLIILGTIFWFTIKGANYPSQLLADILFSFEATLTKWFTYLGSPSWLHGILVLGLYRTLAWVVSVMLPPMAIFFPIFTLLEDLGYLPRIAFNLDHLFKKACAHGKQCLTMCMGLGCNAAGVIGCRIIESPRERIIAIVTNNFIPCNGRFPTLIAISTIFFSLKVAKGSSVIPALSVTLIVILGVLITLLVSYILSKTLLKGIPSTFTLELPPYRKPQIGRVIYTSIIDRTLFVLGRAILVAAPAGILIWILANVTIGDTNLVTHAANFLDPLAKFIGLDGFILMAFILGIPANEIVLPILLMAYLSTGTMIEFDSLDSLKEVLLSNGWTSLTALNTMLFTLLHWPCSTTLWTIKKETGSIKWTILSAAIPTAIAFIICFITTTIYKLAF
ncbi:ferrous iron transport protein B [Clostridium hydrogeniformans]|uniref:ferrous iron transport protein B n=1 Tax=Clostridium hydrogeniformans TaxID=349933 RepID=UPI000488C944|nr:ferrous iron transport protein B [Clostridium hydrogeniformans]